MKATRESYGEALALYGDKYDMVVLDADLSKSTKTETFKKKFPDRFINAGIAEGNMMSVAAGLATCGKVVFASSFAMFAAGRAYEQIRNSIGYPNLNVNIGATHAGISVGEDGATHQCLEDIGIMRTIPNMTIISPCDHTETMAAVQAAIEHNGPCYLRLGRLPSPDICNGPDYSFQLGKGVQLVEGDDVTIVATGIMVSQAINASKILKDMGIGARVIDIHTIKPIDQDIITKAAEETKGIITCEEHNVLCGLGSAVCEVVCANHPTTVLRIGTLDKFGKSGKPEQLFKMYQLTAEDIVEKAKLIVG